MNADIKFYLLLIRKRMPVMVVILVVCAGVGLGLALTMPARYQSSATLLVEGAQLPETLFTSTVQSRAARALQAIELRLMTRANLIDIASKFQVFPEQAGMSPDDIVTAMNDVTEFQILQGRDQATILLISFKSGDPQIAAEVVNEFVTYFLREDVKRRMGESGQTLEFFQQRVENLSQRLSEQSAEIVAYKEANSEALPEGLDFRLSRQSQLQERLNLNARDRTSLVEQRNRILATGSKFGLQGEQRSPIQREIDSLEAELRSKRGVYAPDSPTMKFLRRRIELLEADLLPGEEAATDGVQSMLDLQLAGLDSEILSLDQDTANIEAELAELRKSIDRTPQVAIRLDKLEREYENTQNQYNEAVRARATAEQGADVETSAKGERVVLVESAIVPEAPISPNRKLIAGGGVFAGGALAAIFFVLCELANSTIRRPIDLARGLGIQPLATIPFLEEEAARRRRRIAKLVFIVAVLVAVPLALWAMHSYVMPLDLLADKIMKRAGL